MRKHQRGVSLGGLMVVLFILVIVGLVGMKVVPAYLEFSAIKGAIKKVSGGTNPGDIRKAFDAAAAVDDFTSVKGSDLEITKEGGQVVVRASYRREVPLFMNLGLYFDFAASSKDE